MKKAFASLSVLFLSVVLFAQNATPVAQKKTDDLIKFKEVKYDFGKIKQNVAVTHEFQFENISNQPVVIESAVASCGCTTPTWPQAAIPQGKSEKVTAGFNAASPGTFTKTITVKVAGTDIPAMLTITGNVLSSEEFAKYKDSKPVKSGSK